MSLVRGAGSLLLAVSVVISLVTTLLLLDLWIAVAVCYGTGCGAAVVLLVLAVMAALLTLLLRAVRRLLEAKASDGSLQKAVGGASLAARLLGLLLGADDGGEQGEVDLPARWRHTLICLISCGGCYLISVFLVGPILGMAPDLHLAGNLWARAGFRAWTILLLLATAMILAYVWIGSLRAGVRRFCLGRIGTVLERRERR